MFGETPNIATGTVALPVFRLHLPDEDLPILTAT